MEYIYAQCSDSEKREMIFGVYGNFQLIIKDLQTSHHVGSQPGQLGGGLKELTSKNADKKTEPVRDYTPKERTISLKQFMELKPQLCGGILEKIDPVIQKLLEKGQTRHTIVQAILADYIECETAKEKIESIADTIKSKLAALLASREGLRVACTLFNVLSASDRKRAVKDLPVGEMVANKIAHLFLIHVINTLDDTQLSKTKILHVAIKAIDDHINDNCFQSLLISALTMPTPEHKTEGTKVFYNPFLTEEDLKCFRAGSKLSTSKKDALTRHSELVKVVTKPLSTFFEEKLTYYLQEPKGNILMKALFIAIAAQGISDESDLIDEFLRQVQKSVAFEDGKPSLLLGHPFLHRLIKDMINAEATQTDGTKFASQVAKICLRHFEQLIQGRGVFILIELMEH